MKAPGDTTQPSASTGHRSSATGAVAVRWVYPTQLTTRLVDGLVFGRDGSSTVPLAGHQASRRHAEVRRIGPVPTLRDLGSRNGTWVNGARITERAIGPGDVLRIGEWVGFVLELPETGAVADFKALSPGWYGSGTLARIVDPVQRVAATDLPVIVEGETGTGKEGMARAVHVWSGRPGPFVAVNCAAIPETMAEGELFGYRRGAFTGADRANLGLFRAAHEGTLFLDEVIDLPATVQAKLLRVLEQREVQPLGEARSVAIDVRIVCATQEPLSKATAERRFRPDLLARLDGLTVVLPPLRNRPEDIVPLFMQLLREQTGGRLPDVEPKLIEVLFLYDWPLNVRELVLVVRRLLAIHGHEPTLRRAMLPNRILAPAYAASGAAQSSSPPRAPTTDAPAFDQLLNALRQHGGNVSRAAVALGISRARAYRLLDARPEFDVRTLRDESGQ